VPASALEDAMVLLEAFEDRLDAFVEGIWPAVPDEDEDVG
jgi:hypothetical protein